MQKLFKLNFEKTAIFVLILIIVISTANIYSQFFSAFTKRRQPIKEYTNIIDNGNFPASLLKADQLYMQEDYKAAQSEYFNLTGMQNLSSQQKATVYFKLGICNYKLNEYDLALDSFLKSAEFNTGDPVAYNNAAVCAFYMRDMEKAAELQNSAISILPVIEYQYNLARIYEDWGRYEDSVGYFTAVVKAEENITREDRIDPVRIKNKVMKLSSNIIDSGKMSKELMIALKLKDTREVFIIEDVNMDIKNKDFKWELRKTNDRNKLYCSYNRKKSDPYNLIDSIKWSVKRGGKTVYSNTEDSFSYLLSEGSSYSVNLDITYSTNKIASSFANVLKSSGSYSNNVTPKPTPSPAEEKCKYYDYAVYEQVFENNFNISENGYVDRFNTIWGKDNIEAEIIDKDFRDAAAALLIRNTDSKRAGIWADLSSLINDKQLKGRTIGIKFYTRKVTDSAGLYINIRTKTGRSYKSIPKKLQLDNKWQQYGYEVTIPTNADGLTISFKTDSGEAIKIDGFIVYIIK